MASRIQREPHPWNSRPGSENGPPTGDAWRELHAAAGAWHELVSFAEAFHPLSGGLPLEQAGGPFVYTTPAFKRPLRFRAIFAGPELRFCGNFNIEQGGRCRQATLLGGRLVTAESIRGTPIFEFWLARTRRPDFEDCWEIVSSFHCGYGYREGLMSGMDDWSLAEPCLDHLAFAAQYLPGHEPLHWWLAGRHDDGFTPSIPEQRRD